MLPPDLVNISRNKRIGLLSEVIFCFENVVPSEFSYYVCTEYGENKVVIVIWPLKLENEVLINRLTLRFCERTW